MMNPAKNAGESLEPFNAVASIGPLGFFRRCNPVLFWMRPVCLCLRDAESMRDATPIQNERQFSERVRAAQTGPVTIERQNRQLALI